MGFYRNFSAMPVAIKSAIPAPATVNFFAIGTWINKASLTLHSIEPASAAPATLPDFRVLYKGAHGLATLDKLKGVECDGVMYELSQEQMTKLDAMMNPAVRTQTRCKRVRDGRQMDCVVYIEDNSKTSKTIKDELPSKSYIDFIVQGMTEHSFDKKTIDKLALTRTDKGALSREYQALQYDAGLPSGHSRNWQTWLLPASASTL